jgi:hypothetical protein
MTPNIAPEAKAAVFMNPFVPRNAKPAAKADKTVSHGDAGSRGRLANVGRTYVNPYVALSASSQALTSRIDE